MKSKIFFISAVVILLLTVGITWAFAQSEGTIMACAAKDGTMKLIADPSECYKDKETLLEWNVVGPQGPPGVFGFYYASQDQKYLPPGDFGGVRSWCDLGDFAVGGSVVIYADDFNMISSNPVIDGSSGQHSWVLQGTNEGTSDADIRVSAVCADFTE